MSINWNNQIILAPLTKGGNLPFRRLCVDFGATITTSEMIHARKIAKGERRDLVLMRKAANERCFGVQLAARTAEDAAAAGRIAVEQQAAFVDINAGCPIHDAVRRGLGAALLKRPAALVQVLEALISELDIPVTVKLRAGWNAAHINVEQLAQAAAAAGVAAVTVHGRTREQRYTKAADWELIRTVSQSCPAPVIGNGDILTVYEARQRKAQSGCASLMLARGALIKPWLFKEIADDQEWLPSPDERVAVYRRLACYMKEHFRDDALGKKRAMNFLPWHFDFFCRYQPLPEADWAERAKQHPLLQTRLDAEEGLPPLENLLRDPREETHKKLAELLWDSESDQEAVAQCKQLSESVTPVEMDERPLRQVQG